MSLLVVIKKTKKLKVKTMGIWLIFLPLKSPDKKVKKLQPLLIATM
jgi:hypothetical protein